MPRRAIVLSGWIAGLAGLVATAPPVRAQSVDATCTSCHASQADELATSVHRTLTCRECHKGEASYALPEADLQRLRLRAAESGLTFDHGASFAGRATRRDVPVLCGTCHEDVERMNPYGLRTDQLARYWTSHHGKTLKQKGDERVAVCTDCHHTHGVLPAGDPNSLTHPFNVPDMCGRCHADASLMADYGVPMEVVEEYRQSVHGTLLSQGDSGAPTCATCHGNHSAMPPGFASVGAVCGQCHQHDAKYFATSVHAAQEGHRGCVQCHGGGKGRHFHLIERITKPPGVMIERYAHLLRSESRPSAEQVREAIHPDPRAILTQALPTCTECHEEIGEDESLPKLFGLLDRIAEAERYYVETANRLNEIGKGVVLVENQRFMFEDAKTHLIALAPIQHTLDNELVEAKVAELNEVCREVNDDLNNLETGLRWRRWSLLPVWSFAGVFSIALYVKFKRLKRAFVQPLP